MKAYAVIGANYGDEGKGLITDYFARQLPRPVVVRFNGGAQAGHTVVYEGKRHTFSHVGSGTLAGVPTYLTKDFIVNPTLFVKELNSLTSKLDKHLSVYVDPNALVTTHYDMIINQAIEESRGSMAHGSCGVGINETIHRSLSRSQRPVFRVADLWKMTHHELKTELLAIRDVYVPQRLTKLGIYGLPPHIGTLMYGEFALNNFIQDCREFTRYVSLLAINQLHDSFDSLIFEGAQGLALDQHRGEFPHVTRSCTGTQNVQAMCADLRIPEIETTYVTRWYLTRHGNGQLPHELYQPLQVDDKTNTPNQWQGTIRYAPLDWKALLKRIAQDYKTFVGAKVVPNIAITCLDQVPNGELYLYDDDRAQFEGQLLRFADSAKFLKHVGEHAIKYVSHGPSHADVIKLT